MHRSVVGAVVQLAHNAVGKVDAIQAPQEGWRVLPKTLLEPYSLSESAL